MFPEKARASELKFPNGDDEFRWPTFHQGDDIGFCLAGHPNSPMTVKRVI